MMWNTSHRLGALALTICTVLVWSVSADELRSVKVGEPMPDFQLPTLEGETISRSDYEDTAYVIVYLSAEQRSSEMAARAAYAVHTELNDPKLKLLLVTANASKAGYFRSFRDTAGIHTPLGLDIERKVYGDLGLIVLPTTVVVTPEGMLAHVISSYKSDYESTLKAYGEHALGRLTDEQLAGRIESRHVERDRPNERIARHRSTARLLRSKGLKGDAENELHAALKINAEHIDTRLDLAALYIDMQRVNDATSIVEQVLKTDPEHRRGKLLRGIVLYERGELDEAKTLLTEVLLLNPDPVYTHYYLGLIAEKQGDSKTAARHFRESLQRVLRERPL